MISHILDAISPADSTKQVITGLVDTIKSDPNVFLSTLGKEAIHFGLKLLAAIIIYMAGIWLIGRVKKLLMRIFEKKGTEETLVSFISSFVSISLTVLLIIIVIGALGINTTSLAALLAAGGMAAGMALSGTLQNFAGGVMILIFKPFKTGDFIKAQGYEGYVTEVNIVHTKIRQYDNSIVILPNGALSNGNINNVSHNTQHRVSWTVDLEYGADVDKAREIMLDALEGDKRVLHSGDGAPEPVVIFDKFADSSIRLTMRAWTEIANYWGLLSDVNEKLYKRLPAAGLNFPYPQMDVHVKN